LLAGSVARERVRIHHAEYVVVELVAVMVEPACRRKDPYVATIRVSVGVVRD
jgi:hypothetical protein